MSLFEIKPKIYGAWQPEEFSYIAVGSNYAKEIRVEQLEITKFINQKNKAKISAK